MGSLLSDNSDKQLVNILIIGSDKIIINNNNTITINQSSFHIYSDIKDNCLNILKESILNNCKIKIFYYETTIYGLCVQELLFDRTYLSKILLTNFPSGNYLNKKID